MMLMMRLFTHLWSSVVCCVVILASSPTVIGSDRSRSSKCPSDVRSETRRCLQDYNSQLDSLLETDNRFFPGIDVERIRLLCSILDDSMRCVHGLVELCPKNEQQRIIEDELIPHLGVRELCVHPNIYEEYAMTQNCFARVRPEAENCYRSFTIAVQDVEPERQSSSSSSQRHQTSQQRQHCAHVKKLISCVKNHVRSGHGNCQKTAPKLVDLLVRASLPTTVSCRDEPNATSPPPAGKTLVIGPDDYDVPSAGSRVQGLLTCGPITLIGCFLIYFFVACILSSCTYQHPLPIVASSPASSSSSSSSSHLRRRLHDGTSASR